MKWQRLVLPQLLSLQVTLRRAEQPGDRMTPYFLSLPGTTFCVSGFLFGCQTPKSIFQPALTAILTSSQERCEVRCLFSVCTCLLTLFSTGSALNMVVLFFPPFLLCFVTTRTSSCTYKEVVCPLRTDETLFLSPASVIYCLP